MSKELTPLQALEKLTNYKCSCMSEKIECKNIIETALKENERLKTSYLEKILNEESKEYIYKKLKALEIIIEKEVNIHLFIMSARLTIIDVISKEQFVSKQAQLDMYNNGVVDNSAYVRDYSKCLTKKEYDLLKEVLL